MHSGNVKWHFKKLHIFLWIFIQRNNSLTESIMTGKGEIWRRFFFGIQLLSKAKIIKILHQSNFERFVYESKDFVIFFRMRINNEKIAFYLKFISVISEIIKSLSLYWIDWKRLYRDLWICLVCKNRMISTAKSVEAQLWIIFYWNSIAELLVQEYWCY